MRLILVVLVGLLMVACGQIIGADAYSASDDSDASRSATPNSTALDSGALDEPSSGRCGGFFYATRECSACMDASCCDVLDECSRDPGCRGLNDCLMLCGADDEACRSTCAMRYYGSTLSCTQETAVEQCMATRCSNDCGRTCGAPQIPTGCGQCLVAGGCCGVAHALAQDLDALSYAGCRRFNPETLCDAPAGDARVLWDEWSECRSACASECDQAEPDWSCLGSVVWPSPALSLGTVDVRVRAANPLNGAPLEGVQVTACNDADPSCTLTSGSTSTGTDGIAHLSGDPAPSTYYLARDPTGVYGDHLAFPRPPYAHSPVRVPMPMNSKAVMQVYADILGEPWDVTKPHVHVMVRSCGGATAPGVVLSSPDAPEAVPWYNSETNLALADVAETTSSSEGGFALVPPTMTIEARLGEGGPLIARETVYTASGGMTFLWLVPSPASERP